MTMMQQQAVEIIKRLPDDKIYYVVNILENIENLTYGPQESERTSAQIAYEDLQRFRKSSPIERNYKEELAEALEEKYAGIG